jgi:ABC-type glycerol-3-phosphate transport system substrate-binding protein
MFGSKHSGRTAFRRTVAAVATVALSGLLLTACSSGSSSPTKLTPGPVPDAKTSLTVWSFLPGNYDKGKEAYDAIADGFHEKFPQVTVKIVDMPYPTYFDQVRNATVAQKGPDVITMYGGAQAMSYKNGLFPLQDAMEPDIKENLKFVADNFSKDGNLYILPTGTYGYAMMVNQDKFTEAGVDPVAGLKDWPSLLDTCKTLSAQGIQPIASGWKDGFLFETFMYMISSQMMDTDTLNQWVAGKIPLDDKMFAQATSYITGMNDAGCFGGKEALGRNMYDDAFNQYYAGESAMMVTGSLNTAQQSYDAIPSSTVLALPQVPSSKHKALLDAGAEGGWSVTKWTKSPEASVAFVNYMAGPQAQKILWDKAGVPPNLKNVSVEATTPMQKAFFPLLENPENHTGFAAFPLPVLATFERNAAPLMGGTMTEAEFLAQAQSAFVKAK